jgi:hypothetical protein
MVDMDKYTAAVTSRPCPRETCRAKTGEVCRTSGVVHDERRQEAIDAGLWNVDDALRATQDYDIEHPFYAGGSPLEALKPAGRKRGRQR